MKSKSLEFLLQSWDAAGGPNVYGKADPSCGTNNIESLLAKLQPYIAIGPFKVTDGHRF